MDDKQAAAKMAEIARNYGDDEERAHRMADDLLCELLRELGYLETVAAFEAIDKWYA